MSAEYSGFSNVYTDGVLHVPSVAYLPIASEFNGVAQVGNDSFVSNANIFKSADGRILSKHKPVFAYMGDSTASFGFVGGTCSITHSGTTATMTYASHGVNRGAMISIGQAPHSEYNGIFKVASAPTSGTLTFELASPVTSVSTGSTPVVSFLQRGKTNNWADLANQRSNSPLTFGNNFAVGNSLTADLERQHALLINPANFLGTVTKADIVFISTGINDAINGIDYTVTLANALAAIDRLVSAGIYPVLLTQMPFGAAHVLYTTAVSAASRKYNAAIKEIAGTDPRFMLIDSYALLADATNNYEWLLGYSTDGLHPVTAGASVIANYLVTNLFSKISYTDTRLLSNSMLNPPMTGTAGAKTGVGVSGSVADNFEVAAGGGGSQLAVCSKGVSLSGATEKQVIAFNPAAAGDQVDMLKELYTTLTVGKKYYVRATVNLVGAGRLRELAVYISCTLDTALATLGVNSTFETIDFAGNQTLVIESMPVEFMAGCTRFRPYVRARSVDGTDLTIEIADYALLSVD